MDSTQPLQQESPAAPVQPAAPTSISSPATASPANISRKRSASSRHSLESSGPYGGYMASPQQHQQGHLSLPALTNVDPALEGVVKNFMRSEKYARKIKYIVRSTAVPGRQNYKFAPATSLTQQETRLWRNNLIQDEVASNNPFWTARWMRVFGMAPRLDDSLLKVPWIKCERPASNDEDTKSALPLHRKETYLDLRDQQNRNWAMDSFSTGIDFAQKGQLDDAIKAYSQAIQIDAKCVEAYVARGCTLANLKKWRGAVMDFRAALALDPSNVSARQYLESTIAQEEEHRLNPTLDTIVPDDVGSPEISASFGGPTNLDNINEIVLDTDVLESVDTGNVNGERKKKKKKNKNKRKNRRDDLDHYDGSERARDIITSAVSTSITVKESSSTALRPTVTSSTRWKSEEIKVASSVTLTISFPVSLLNETARWRRIALSPREAPARRRQQPTQQGV
ncbi:hypothetical protein BGZ98_002156 [Dissophora globulifera]|nr:hypothetical protein BGZ98_002156 [Dissophora globulifera]